MLATFSPRPQPTVYAHHVSEATGRIIRSAALPLSAVPDDDRLTSELERIEDENLWITAAHLKAVARLVHENR